MGDFSRNTFDKSKHYVGVRLQQGVPLFDADWNEQEDIRKYELQSFRKWFAGNGVPAGNDGFRIIACDAENDFIIRGGDGTPEGAGRCLVEGWEVINENKDSDLKYKGQRLYNNQTLAEAWGVEPVAPLKTPGANHRKDLVYLDTWEREVDADEDEDLVNNAIGIETCVRLKREWVVRVVEGTTTPPTPAKGTPSEGHAFYLLAVLSRDNQSIIKDEQVQDVRQTGLSIVLRGNLVTALTGNVSVQQGTSKVTGTDTSFTTELRAGDAIKIADEVFTVSKITHDTDLTLDANHSAGASNATAYMDSDLFLVRSGAGQPKAVINKSGDVGIGTSEPAYMLHVNGTAGKPGGGTWGDSSDQRLRKEVENLTGALDRLTRLQGVTFTWINPEEHGKRTCTQAGLIAQEVEKVFPEWVSEVKPSGKDQELTGAGEKVKTLQFPHGFNAYLIEAIKELKMQNEELQARNEELQARIEALEQKG